MNWRDDFPYSRRPLLTESRAASYHLALECAAVNAPSNYSGRTSFKQARQRAPNTV